MFIVTWFARTVEGESKDDLKRWTLNHIHLIRLFQNPELWSHVSALLAPEGLLDISIVIKKDNMVDVEYLLSSAVASDVTILK